MILRRPSYLFLSHLKKQKFPVELIYFVTNKCNSRCRGCFYWQEINKEIRELTLEEIDKISVSIGELKLLFLSGGEPFLREDLPEILDVFIKNCHPASISIPTNGLSHEVTLSQAQKIVSGHRHTPFHFALALDGLQETNDFLRNRKGSFDAVFKTAQGLCGLKKAYPNLFVFIVTTVSGRNYNEIEPLFKCVKERLAIDRHLLQPLRGRPMDVGIVPPNGSDWIKLLDRLNPYKQYYLSKMKSRTSLFLFLLGTASVAKVTANSLDGEKWPFGCKAGQSVGVLDPDGAVRMCELTEKIGNVRNAGYDFKKIWNSPEAGKVRENIITRECTRGCTHGCYLNPSFMSNPFNAVNVFCQKQRSKPGF